MLRLLALVVLLGGSWASQAAATTMRHLDTRALALGSSEIVIGAVESMRPRWSADHRRIFTDVEIRVERPLKGAAGDRLTLVQLGGEIDGVRYSVPGAPQFRAGEEALLFIWRDARGRAQVHGLAQGKFDIERDPKTGAVTVQRTMPGFAVKDARTLGAAGAAPAARIPLDELVREIQRALSRGDDR